MGKTIVDGAVDDFDKALKPYVCHKTVHAAEITSVGEQGAESEKRSVTLVNRFTILLPEIMFVRYTPAPGDFLVVYEDGYESFSPRKAFLEGYTREEAHTAILLRIDQAMAPSIGVEVGAYQGLMELLRDCRAEIERLRADTVITRQMSGFREIKQGIKDGKANPDQA